MLARFRDWYDKFRGAGEYAITVPPMDGALRPNSALEQAEALFDWPAPDNLVAAGDRVWFSSGADVFGFTMGAAPVRLASHAAEVTALAVRDDALATGLGSGNVLITGGPHAGRNLTASADLPITCPVALSFRDADTLLVANGASQHSASEWRHDLLMRGASGSVWAVDLRSGKADCLARHLAWPRGLMPLPDGGVLVSEAWRSRLIILRPGAAPEPVLTDLPAYPGGISAGGAGYFLCLFAPRRRLTELVMREPPYRDRMMAEIEPEYWISPSLRPMHSYYEPLQGGTLKKLAMIKPWAPSRSYGLIVELGPLFDPVRSFHSRADGTRHGISSCAAVGPRIVAAATGGDVVFALDTGA